MDAIRGDLPDRGFKRRDPASPLEPSVTASKLLKIVYLKQELPFDNWGLVILPTRLWALWEFSGLGRWWVCEPHPDTLGRPVSAIKAGVAAVIERMFNDNRQLPMITVVRQP